MISGAYDTRYYRGVYPIVHLKFVPEAEDGEPHVRPALLDSGSPFNFMPEDLISDLNLTLDRVEVDEPIPTPFGEATHRYIGGVKINGRLIEVAFWQWPPAFRPLFYKRPQHAGLSTFALLGTDVFKGLLVAFDQKTSKVFLGSRKKLVTLSMLRLISAFSREGPQEQAANARS